MSRRASEVDLRSAGAQRLTPFQRTMQRNWWRAFPVQGFANSQRQSLEINPFRDEYRSRRHGTLQFQPNTALLISLNVLLPLALIAAVLYTQPDPELFQVGRCAHILSVLAAFVACVTAIRISSAKALILVSLSITLLFSVVPGMRTLYLTTLSFVFFTSGAALIKYCRGYVIALLAAIGGVSLILMMLQLYGTPLWANSLATQGLAADGGRAGAEVAPTLFVEAKGLAAQYWQTRPAGLFASNQFNTLFFFVIFSASMSLRGRLGHISAPLLALYAMMTLSKAAFLGSLSIYVTLAMLFRHQFILRSVIYCLSLAGIFLVYKELFPGVVATFFSFYVLFVSLVARFFDLAAAAGLEHLVTYVSSFAGDTGDLARAIRDAMKAFAPDGSPNPLNPANLDFDRLGATSLFSQIARHPTVSLVIAMSAVAIAIAISRARTNRWKPTAFEISALLGMGIFAAVADTSTQQIYWLFVGFGFAGFFDYILIRKPQAFGLSSQHHASQTA